MGQITELIKNHIGVWVNIYVTGSFGNAVGGKIKQVCEQYVELDQEENLLAYVPLASIVYLTIQKPGN